MAQINQLGGVPGLDLAFKNYTGADIAAGIAVKLDAANPPNTNVAGGVILPTSDVDAFGVTMEILPAGKIGRVRVGGVVVATASATITYGDVLMADAAGKVLPQTAGKCQIGRALSSAVAGDAVNVHIAVAKNA